MNRRLGKIEFSFCEVKKNRITESRQWQMSYIEQDSLARSPAKLNQTNVCLLSLSPSRLHAYLSLRSAYYLSYNWLLTGNNTSVFVGLQAQILT